MTKFKLTCALIAILFLGSGMIIALLSGIDGVVYGASASALTFIVGIVLGRKPQLMRPGVKDGH